MKKSIFLFFAAILCAIGMNAKTTATVYYSIPASTVGCYTVKCYYNFGYSQTGLVEMTKVDKTSSGNLIYSVKLTANNDNVDNLLFQLFDGDTWKSEQQVMKGWTPLANNSGKMYVHNTGWKAYSTDASYTVYFVNKDSWTGTIKAYAWNSDCDKNKDWSGADMTSTGKTYKGKDIYSITLNKRYAKIIFNNSSSQTDDLTLGSTYIGKMYDGSSWVTYNVDPVVTFKANGGTGNDHTQTVHYNTSTALTANTFTRTGYTFAGWNTKTDGTGTSYSDKQKVTLTANTTLYAKWTENTYTVTISAGTGGTVSPSGSQTIGQVTQTTVTATANDNYEFANWTATGGVIVANNSAASTTITATAAGTLTANFRSTATYSLTVAEGAGIASVAGSTDPVTLGNTYEIKATPKTGYTFSTWTANPAANATFNSATTAETTVTVNNGSVTVTASATEILAELTTANSFDAGKPSLADPTTTEEKIGVATTATVTAKAAPAGYTFTGWTLEKCVSADDLSKNSITVKSTGTEDKATATANYEIDKYYVVGSFNEWNTSDASYKMIFEDGVYKKEVTLKKDDMFKICNGSWSASWSYNNLQGIEYKELVKSDEENQNIKLTKDATFTIIFDLSKHFITFEGLNEKYTYVLMGVNKDWTTGIVMERNPNNTHERMLTCQPIEKANDAIKVAILEEGKDAVYCDAVADNSVSHTRGEHNNIVLEDGVYDFYYKIDENNVYIGPSTCIPTFEISATAENGTVEGAGTYNYKATATLKANPAEGYHFEKWSNGSTDNPLNIIVTEDVELQAIFAINTYTVTATATEGGTVTDAGTYNHGTSVTLTATANEGYKFVNWTKEGVEVSTDATYTFTATEDVTLTANFELKSYTITATAENGTVEGAGTYTHGTSVILTATPNFDYNFVNWTVGSEVVSTDNPYTFPASANVEVVANFQEVTATDQTLSGKFSTGKYEYAEFATGNLQHNPKSDEWRFAKQQYQVVGEDNINVGDENYEGWIDMFGWSADGKFGVNPSNKNEDYYGAFVDWGTKMGEGWLTLSADQWKYLLNERTDAASLKQIAKVGEILGIMLFPDNWTHPADCSVTPTTNHDPEDGEDTSYDFDSYNYTLTQWTKLEEAGAIFLPAAGRRTGGYGNMINKDQVKETNPANLNGGHYKHQDNTNIYCYYWTSTINESTKDVSFLHNIQALGGDKYTIGTGAIWGEKGRYGQSVRLAKVTSTLIEIGDGNNSAVITPNAGKTVNVQLNRSFTAGVGYYTLCLPFDIAAEKIGTAYQLGEITEHVSGEKGGININLTEVDKIEAGVPYLVLPKTLENPVFENVEIVNTTGSDYTVTGAGVKVTFTGIINGKGEKTNGETEYYVGDEGKLYNGKVDKLGLRAFFTITDEAGNKVNVRARVVAGENVETGVEDIITTDAPVKVIENGQLIIIRDGVKYNVQGQRL